MDANSIVLGAAVIISVILAIDGKSFDDYLFDPLMFVFLIGLIVAMVGFVVAYVSNNFGLVSICIYIGFFLMGIFVLSLILRWLFEFLRLGFSAIKWNRFFARNPEIKAKIIAATEELQQQRQDKFVRENDEIKTVSEKTGYPVEWVQKATKEFYKKQWGKKKKNESRKEGKTL